MADSYQLVRSGKLKLKGGKDKSSKKHKKHKHSHSSKQEPEVSDQAINKEDITIHGGWWPAGKFDDISGSVAIEFGSMRYIQALDNGLFKLGKQHENGESPNPEEILTAIRVSGTQVALKSGYGKYLGVQSDGKVTGRADAISGREQWEPVFQDGKLALLGSNDCFLTTPVDDAKLFCTSKTAGDSEMIQIRSSAIVEVKDTSSKLDKGTSKDVELNYVKHFQSFQDRRIRMSGEQLSTVKRARHDGNLHEVLLDRREKMKSDKFCK